MNTETQPITLTRRTPSETQAYYQGVESGLLMALRIVETPGSNPIELLLTCLEVHRAVRQQSKQQGDWTAKDASGSHDGGGPA
jgi:hypothetical protein